MVDAVACNRVVVAALADVAVWTASVAAASGVTGSAVMAGGDGCAENKVRATGDTIGSAGEGVTDAGMAADATVDEWREG